jgi:hypothetical protein
MKTPLLAVFLSVSPITAAIACTQHSASEIADAIRNSPNTNGAMQSTSCIWGGAAIAESGGNTCASNGNNFGVLQLTRGNLPDGMSPSEYMALSLQDQVNLWAEQTTANFGSGYQALAYAQASGGFIGGVEVTEGMLAACYQFGPVICNNNVNALQSGQACSGAGIRATGGRNGTLANGTATLDGNGHSVCSWGKAINNQIASNAKNCEKCKPEDGNAIPSPSPSEGDIEVESIPI